MPQRLTPLEVFLLALDTPRTPGHLGTVAVFEAKSTSPERPRFDLEPLRALVEERIAFVPRYRQRVHRVPFELAAPAWVDDAAFDVDFHVRRVVLPPPGTAEQMDELVGRVLADRLDRSRPLWELYLVEGLEDGRFALVEKTHPALVDGLDTVDLVQVLLDSEADVGEGERPQPPPWRPLPNPTPFDLVGSALWESARDPFRAAENLQGLVIAGLSPVVAVADVIDAFAVGVGDRVEDALRGRPRSPQSPLAGSGSGERRFASLRMALPDLQRVAEANGGSVHDVVLTVITGGLRAWLLERGVALNPSSTLTALVPTAVVEGEDSASSLGVQVVPHLQQLPIGEPDARERSRLLRGGARGAGDPQAVDARTLAEIPGFAAATLHTLGVRSSRQTGVGEADLVITDVPGPQQPLYVAGARMVDTASVLPLPAGRLLSIGVTSYDGEVFVGLHADRDAVGDPDVLVRGLSDALAELLDMTVP